MNAGFLKENRCKYGERCRYSHKLKDQSQKLKEQNQVRENEHNDFFLQPNGMERRLTEIERIVRQLMFRPSFSMGPHH